MIREPYIGMPIIIGGTPGPVPGQNTPSRAAQPETAPQTAPQAAPAHQHGPAHQQPQAPGFDGKLLGSLPAAMTYTPMQQWKSVYSSAEALNRGTVFPELELPFEGRTI